ncbi:MAG TPA: hypothetical protein VM841_04590 [Actinomycetota bacterium]|nr:hypothetical protein [Actinomycetota bacterium]
MSAPRWYRAVLLLYPRTFRREYGDEMVAVLEDMMAGGARGPGLVTRIVRDVVVSVPRIRREETTMATKAIIAGVLVLTVGLAVAGTGSVALGGIVSGTVLAVVLGGATLLARRGSASTEAAYRAARPVWPVAAAFVGAYALFTAVQQYVSEPTAASRSQLLFGLIAPALVAGGLWARAAGRRWAAIPIVAGCAPLLVVFWFVPVPVAALVAVIGSIAESMRASSRPRPAV